MTRRAESDGQEYRMGIRLVGGTHADLERVWGWWRPCGPDRAVGHVQQIVSSGGRGEVEEPEQSDAGAPGAPSSREVKGAFVRGDRLQDCVGRVIKGLERRRGRAVRQ